MESPTPLHSRRRFISWRSYLLLVGTIGVGFQLWWRWAPWEKEGKGWGAQPKIEAMKERYNRRKSTAHGIRFEAGRPPIYLLAPEYSSTGDRYCTRQGGLRIFDSQSTRMLCVVDPRDIEYVEFSKDGGRLFGLYWAQGKFNLDIWFRRRPENFWGIAWLPAFWQLLLWVCACSLSLHQDRIDWRTWMENVFGGRARVTTTRNRILQGPRVGSSWMASTGS